jgi:hypothetical protein
MLILALTTSPPSSSPTGAKYEHDLHHDLTRATAFEAVMRVRATRGIRFSNFYGNYFIRGTDLLALPNCTSDSSFSLDMAYDEAVLSAQAITIQVRLDFMQYICQLLLLSICLVRGHTLACCLLGVYIAAVTTCDFTRLT